MDIHFNKDKEAASLEFLSFYEKTLAEAMDPFRRCRVGEFDARDLEPSVLEAFWCYETEKQKGKLDELFQKTNLLFDRYYQGTKKKFGIAPDIFAYRNVVEDELKRLRQKKL